MSKDMVQTAVWLPRKVHAELSQHPRGLGYALREKIAYASRTEDALSFIRATLDFVELPTFKEDV